MATFKLHVPTGDYAFVEEDVVGEVADAVTRYKEITNAFHGGFGITVPEFNKALDLYLEKNTGDVDLYMKMSKEQQCVFQEIKKSLKRIEAKNNK